MRSAKVSCCLVAVLAGCIGAAANGRDALLAEIRTRLQRPEWRAHVLERALVLHDPACLAFALPWLDDPDPYVQRVAWEIRIELDERDVGATFRAALLHHDWFVRVHAASAARRRAPDDVAVDAALARTLSQEEVGMVLARAARSLAERRPDGARTVFDRLAARGAAWIGCGLVAYAASPAPQFETAFREALASEQLDQRILGARGLLALGAAADPEAVAAIAARRTYDEFNEYVLRIDRGHGPAVPSSWEELVRAASAARVVVLGESHGSVPDGAVQCALLGALRPPGQAPVTLLYERPMQRDQRLPVTAAAMLGFSTQLLEATPSTPPTVFERDEEARRNLIAGLEADPERHWVVVYGNGHRESFVRCLREHGVDCVAITTSGTGEMLAAAWTCAGTLAIRGRVFRYADGTFYVAAQPQIEDLRVSEPGAGEQVESAR